MKYAHIGITDQPKAVAKLPAPRTADDSALHGRCISGGVRCHSPSSAGKTDDPEKSQNPCGDRGFGIKRRHLANGGKVEAAGIVPASCSNITKSDCCLYEHCQHPCAARALHSGGLNCHFLTSLDADLQRVLAAWERLPPAIRRATLALLEAH
jgi:hypothetical protein